MRLMPWQRRLEKALEQGAPVGAVSLARGNGKTWLAAHLLRRCLDPRDKVFFRPGYESVIHASTQRQGRLVYLALKEMLDDEEEYKYLDSSLSIAVVHRKTRTSVRVASGSGKSALGLGATNRLLILDEPGSLVGTKAQELFDSLTTSLGKSDCQLLLVGTRAPAGPHHFWPRLLDAPPADWFVEVVQADSTRWNLMAELMKANPWARRSSRFRETLKSELKEARRSEVSRERFLKYRLNLSDLSDESSLFTLAEWKTILARPAAEPDGQCIIGLDLGGSRSWSAATCIHASGLIEAVAVMGGNVDDAERRDQIVRGSYKACVREGSLLVDPDGRRCPDLSPLAAWIDARRPLVVAGDLFRADEMADLLDGKWIFESRRTRWSESTFDIDALMKLAHDEDMSVAPDCVKLLSVSLAGARVKPDDAGNVRLTKRHAEYSRSDPVQALVCAAGARRRHLKDVPEPTWSFSPAS